MDKAGKFIAMLIKRFWAKTPKSARVTQYVVGGFGTAAIVALSIPSLGLPLWASIGVGLVAATSMAYEQIKDESDKTVIQESKKIFQDKTQCEK
ncbi:MAG: hypothetical protein QM487_14290 [Candidatus Marithrix sp.]